MHCSQQNIRIYLIIGERVHTSLEEILTSVGLSNSSKLQSCHLNHSPSLATIKEKSIGYKTRKKYFLIC